MYTLNCNYQFSCGLQLQCVCLLPRKGIGFGNLSHCNNCWNFNINWLSLTSLLSDTMKFEMKSVKKYWKWKKLESAAISAFLHETRTRALEDTRWRARQWCFDFNRSLGTFRSESSFCHLYKIRSMSSRRLLKTPDMRLNKTFRSESSFCHFYIGNSWNPPDVYLKKT